MRKPLLLLDLFATGASALVPPFVVGALLPLMFLLVASTGNGALLGTYVDLSTRWAGPALAAWWPAFAFRERFESEGRELLYLLRPRGSGGTALALALLYWVALTPFIAITDHAMPGFFRATGGLLLVRSLFVTAFSFCTAVLTRSSTLALALALLATLVAMVPFETLIAAVTAQTNVGQTPLLCVYLALSAALLFVGEAGSRRFTR